MLNQRMGILALVMMLGGCFYSSAKKYDGSKITIDQDTYPAIVLGGGVAGLTAANYLAQAQIPCVVIEGKKPGGALVQSDSVQNWPGVTDAPGSAIVGTLKDQIVQKGVQIHAATVTGIDCSLWPYRITTKNLVTGDVQILKGLTVIIAVGAEPNYLKVPGEQEWWGKGVTNCAICDGALQKGNDVVVVGGGDSAVVEALYLARIARKVDVLVRKESLRARDKNKVEKLLKEKNIAVHFNTQVQEILGSNKKLEGVKILNNKTHEESILPVQGVFLAIGSTPNTQLVSGQLDLDVSGYIVLGSHQETSQPGIFAAGDVCDPVFKQAVTSAADGCKAALQAESFLSEVNAEVSKFIGKQQDDSVETKTHKAGGEIISVVSNQEIATLLTKHTNVVLDFSAPRCFACTQMEKVIHEILPAYGDKVTFVMIDVSKKDVNVKALTKSIETEVVTSGPTFVLVKDGKAVDRIEGAISSGAFKEILDKNFKLV